mmetsp:Transcript_70220/g.227338  ORF Transcript_70220/g.227338 Transcript_70220/m.227338 type:complete len:207 (+) Transcript_70220:1892-2512(+)
MIAYRFPPLRYMGSVIFLSTSLFKRSATSISRRGQTSTCVPFGTVSFAKTPPAPPSSTRYSSPIAPPRTARVRRLLQRMRDDSRPGLMKPRLPRNTSISERVHSTASRGSVICEFWYCTSLSTCDSGLMNKPLPSSCPSHCTQASLAFRNVWNWGTFDRSASGSGGPAGGSSCTSSWSQLLVRQAQKAQLPRGSEPSASPCKEGEA